MRSFDLSLACAASCIRLSSFWEYVGSGLSRTPPSPATRSSCPSPALLIFPVLEPPGLSRPRGLSFVFPTLHLERGFAGAETTGASRLARREAEALSRSSLARLLRGVFGAAVFGRDPRRRVALAVSPPSASVIFACNRYAGNR